MAPSEAPNQQNERIERILIVGDSLARGAGDDSGSGLGGHLGAAFPGAEVVNLAIDGATTLDLAERIRRPSIRAVAAQSQVIVISIGGNDLFRASRGAAGAFEPANATMEVLEEVEQRLLSIVEELRAASPDARIFVIGLYDPFVDEERLTARAVAEWNSRLMLALSDDVRTFVVPTYDIFAGADRLSRDRFHPGAEGYRLMAGRILDAIPAGE